MGGLRSQLTYTATIHTHTTRYKSNNIIVMWPHVYQANLVLVVAGARDEGAEEGAWVAGAAVVGLLVGAQV